MVGVVSIIFLVLGVIISLVGIASNFLWLILGVTQIFLALSLIKLNNVENTLSKFVLTFSKFEMPNKRCDKCGRDYDIDVSECPYCELERIKHLHNN